MTKRWLLIAPVFLFLASCSTLDTGILELGKHRGGLKPLLETDKFLADKKEKVDKTVATGPIIYSTDPTSLEQKKREVISKQEPKNYIDLDKNQEDLFPISINLESVDIRDAMTMLAGITGKNILVGDEVTGTVSVRIVDVPWNKALDAILQIKKLAKHVNDEGTIIRIHMQDALIAQEEFERKRREDLIRSIEAEQSIGALYTEIFRLYYTDPATVKSQIQQVLGIGDSEGAEEGASGNGYSVQIAIDQRIKSLIIKANREDLDAIANLIKRIDIRTRQVLIEAFIVEATVDFSKELGTKLGIHDLAYVSSGTTTQISGIGGSQPESGSSITLGDTTGLISNLAVTGGAGVGFLVKRASTALKAELSALEQQGMTKIISNPRVFTLDNQEAVIIQGDEIPYTTASEGGGTEIEFKEAGIQLTVTPSIVGDGNIILTVSVEKKSADTSIPNPPITTRQITTKLLVRDNTIVVIGGVFTQTTTEAEKKVPFLGDIPIIGRLFRYQKEQDARKELLVFLAPRIL